MATELFHGYLRLGNFPLDESSIFSSYQEAYNYAASNETAYAGQIVAVVDVGAEEVTIYSLTFPLTGTGFDLQGVASGSGTVKVLNGIEPNEDGEIVIYGDNIMLTSTDPRTLSEVLQLFEGITETETEFIFNKAINTTQITGITTIAGPTDAVSVQYLEAVIDSSIKGETKMYKGTLNHTGLVYVDIADLYDFQEGDIIKNIQVEIETAYTTGCDITISLDGEVLLGPDDIYEDEVGTYISDIKQTVQNIGPISVTISPASSDTQSSATIYIDFTQNPYE